MITVNFFTSEKHTQPVIMVLKKTKKIKILNIYKKLNTPEMADVFLVADFGEILSDKILNIPKYGSLCIHPSLLPKYRGASPVQFAIMKGEKETGVTILKMDEKVDHGPIIAQFKEKIRDDDTAESLYQRLFQTGAEVLGTILPAWIEGRIKPRPQDDSKATYAPRLLRDDGRIDWKKSDEAIERFIRAMTPWPGSWTMIDGKRLKILKAHLEQPVPIPDRIKGAIGDRDKLVPDQVQLEGKKPITWPQFLAGHPTFRFS